MGTAALLHPAALLEYRGRTLPVSSACLERSEVLSSLLRQAVAGPGGKPTLVLDSTQVLSLQRVVGGQPLPPLSLERFLVALGSGSSGQKTVLERCSEVEQVIQILKLADWFSAHELRQACDERLCTLLHGVSNRQQVSDSREEAASQALEAGVQHCLTKTVGWLLPWALQQLSRGDKDCPGAAAAEQLSGELRSQQQSAWFQDRAARRRRRLHACLMADDQLKVLLMEQQWWAQHDDFEHCCGECGASPSDVRPAFDITGESWLFSREGRSYRAAAAHFAHLLVERNWGLTPAGSGFERLALAAFEAGAPAAPQPQWQQCLAHTCSVSSVGCGRSE